jgi:PST family polysaccharide transporter
MRQRTASAAAIVGVGQAVGALITLVTLAVLARLLEPAEFGLVAMVMTATGVLRVFSDAGLSTASIQKEGISDTEISNLFWANIALGGASSLLVAASAPLLASFYGHPELLWVTLALAPTFLITSASAQPLALLRRGLRFAEASVIRVAAVALGSVIAVWAAWSGAGVWSLIWLQLVPPVFTVAACCLTLRWHPRAPRSHPGTGSLLRFGASLTAGGLIWSLTRSSDGILIGKLYGAEALGHYSRGGALVMRPLEQALAPLDSVFIPTLSRLQGEPERFRAAVLNALESFAIVAFAIAGVLLPLSQALTDVVLGPSWNAAAPVLAAFTAVAAYMPLAAVAGWVLSSQGRGGDFVRLSTISSIAALLSFLAGVPWGPAGVALAHSLTCFLVHLPVAFYFAGSQPPLRTSELWSHVLRHAPLSVVGFAGAAFGQALVSSADPLARVAAGLGGGGIAAALWVVLSPPSRRVALDLVAMARRRHVHATP